MNLSICVKKFTLLFLFFFTLIISRNVSGFVLENSSCGNFISFTDLSFYCAYLYLNKGGGDVENIFVIHSDGDKTYLIPADNFISASRQNIYFPLMKMDFSFLEFKENVIPYLHPNFVIKFLFLLNKINYSTRISDAMRSPKEQIIYKRRGWTDVLVSPHIIGLAVDLSYYSGTSRQEILKYYQPLDIRFLEHGGKYNKHIHLQDNEIWRPIKGANEEVVISASDELNEKAYYNNNIIKTSTVEYTKDRSYDGLKFEFLVEVSCLAKLVFENNIGEKKAEIITGVFETGNHSFYIKYDFLMRGVYKVKFYLNNYFIEERCIVRY